jgi:TRAP-type C4-dicarboxylate transport system permease small subunit
VDAQHPAQSIEELAQSFEQEVEEVDLSGYRIEDWAVFALFWLLCGIVFYQFFTRYALNSSAAWTEEIARYVLVAVVFVGSAMCVRLDTHIHVDFIYRFLPRPVARGLSALVDLLRIAFVGYAIWLTWQVMERVGFQPMTMIDWPMSVVYSFVLAGFVFMLFRAVQLFIIHLKTGSSSLIDPTAFNEVPPDGPTSASV